MPVFGEGLPVLRSLSGWAFLGLRPIDGVPFREVIGGKIALWGR